MARIQFTVLRDGEARTFSRRGRVTDEGFVLTGRALDLEDGDVVTWECDAPKADGAFTVYATTDLH